MYSLRRDATVNVGNTAVVRGSSRESLAMVKVGESQAQTVFVSARLRTPSPNVIPMVQIEWGHGGATMRREYVVVPQLSVCLAGSSIRVDGFLRNRLTGNPPPETVTCDFSAVVAPGSIGRTEHSHWVTQMGASGTLATEPTGLLTIGGYIAPQGTETPPRWLMAFDQTSPPSSNQPPIVAVPLVPLAVNWSQVDRPRPFENGIVWAISSAAITFTAAPTPLAHIEAELTE